MQSLLLGPEEAKQTQEVTMLVQILLSPAAGRDEFSMEKILSDCCRQAE